MDNPLLLGHIDPNRLAYWFEPEAGDITYKYTS